MPGVAQIWLTDDELKDIETALGLLVVEGWESPDNLTSVTAKIRAAREGVACPRPFPTEHATRPATRRR